ncbi:family 78 glycoside hydrolase catalytic domain [Jiangella asiatica]|nr:family 78 glycoside hydrolase catalytic domain [Jiangella asiatica]
MNRSIPVRRSAVLIAVAALVAVTAAAGRAAPADADPGTAGRAPLAPAELTVGDRVQPLNVEGTPSFGWLPRDRDPGEVQTAYQLIVRDVTGEDTVWDSGKVASAEQSYVPYAGPSLDAGTAYTWSVRTWDRTDRPSPWAEAARFETGIPNDGWDGAQWIQRAPGGRSPLEIVDGRVRVTGGDITLADMDATATDYTVELTVRPHTRGAGWTFRSPDRRNGYLWQLVPGEGLNTHLHRNGSSTRLASVPLTIVAGTDYQVRMEIAGSTFRTYVDGVLVDEYEDATFAAGGIGLREASNEIGEFDDIEVTAPDGTVLFSDDFAGDLSKWVAAPPSRQPDEWTLARTEVALRDEPVTQARAYVAASHTYELYVDGQRADRGQSFAYSGENYYQASDVTALVDGKDEIALGAILHWYGGGQGRPAGEPGLLVRLVVEYADGSEQVVVSDGSWKVTEGPYVATSRRNGEGDYIEHLDARRVPAGWGRLGFDDAAWADAVVLGPHPTAPFTHLTGQETRLTETTAEPVALLTAADGTPVIDFGVVIPARPVVRFDDGVAGRTVPMRAGYTLTDDGRVATSTLLSQGTNMSFPYTQVDGAQEFRAFTHLGFRYLELPDAGEEITLDDVEAVVVHTDTPAGREATFESSDDTLDAVWDLMVRSAIYSVQEAFVDTPTREKGQFLGDAVNISYATMAAFGERDATQQAIREFLNSASRFWFSGNDLGRYNAVYPNGDGKRDIPDYSLMFVDWVWRYYQETGDRELLAQAYPSVLNTADYVLRHIPETGPTAGLVTQLSGGSGAYQYGIVDWPAPGRFGYDMSAAARTTINAQGVAVLRDAAAMGAALGRPEAETTQLTEHADRLVERMNETLRRPDGVYVDGLAADGSQSTHAGQHSTTYAIAHGVAPAADHEALAEYVAGLGMKQGPMTAHWILQALADAGRPDAVLEMLTDADDLGWANLLAQDATFTWEAWTLDPGTNFSQSHGWGAQAVVDIQQTLLGVRTTSPGAAAVEIAPPGAGLDQASGTVPTQRGDVTVAWRRIGDGVRLELDVPVNVTARVALPVSAGITYRADGRSPATYLGVEDGRAIFEVGSGHSVYQPVRSTEGARR